MLIVRILVLKFVFERISESRFKANLDGFGRMQLLYVV